MDVDKRNEELDETIIQTCKWIQKKLQISDKSIRDEKSAGAGAFSHCAEEAHCFSRRNAACR